jgi:hypothetical protein
MTKHRFYSAADATVFLDFAGGVYFLRQFSYRTMVNGKYAGVAEPHRADYHSAVIILDAVLPMAMEFGIKSWEAWYVQV